MSLSIIFSFVIFGLLFVAGFLLLSILCLRMLIAAKLFEREIGDFISWMLAGALVVTSVFAGLLVLILRV